MKAQLLSITAQPAQHHEIELAELYNKAYNTPNKAIRQFPGSYILYTGNTWYEIERDDRDSNCVLWQSGIDGDFNNLHRTLKDAIHSCIEYEKEMTMTTPQYKIMLANDKIASRLEHIKAEMHYLDSEYCHMDSEEIKAALWMLYNERANIRLQQSHTPINDGSSVGWTMPETLPYNEPVEPVETITPHTGDVVTIPSKRALAYPKYYAHVQPITKTLPPKTNHDSNLSDIPTWESYRIEDIRQKAFKRRCTLQYCIDLANTLISGKQAVYEAIAVMSDKHDDRLQDYVSDITAMVNLYHTTNVKNTYVEKAKIHVTVDKITKTFTLTKSGRYPKTMHNWLERITGRVWEQFEIVGSSQITISTHKPAKTCKPAKITKVKPATTPIPKTGLFTTRINPLPKMS